MKFQFNTNDVLPQMASVFKVIQSKNTMPILDNFVVKTVNKSPNDFIIELTSSDTTQWLKMSSPLLECDAEMTFLVDGKKFLQTLSGLNGKIVTIELDEQKKMINGKYDNGMFNLPYDSNIEDFPTPKIEGGVLSNVINVSSNDLYKTITSTAYCASNDPIRQIMQCVHFDISQNGFVLCASDGFKLAKAEMKEAWTNEEQYNFNIMQKTIDVVAQALVKKDCNVQISFNEKNAMFSCDDFTLITRLQEGKYPDFERVIPKDNDKKAIINKQKLIDALQHISVLGEKTQNLIHFDFNESMLKVTATDVDFSTGAEETIECNYQGESLHIGLKGIAVATILSKIQSDDVVMSMSVASRPVIFTQKEEDDKVHVLSLLMPMLLN